MVKFVSGAALSASIRHVLAGRNARCAAAFWGAGAAEQLFGGRAKGRRDLRIVCDISMGGTNPGELAELGAPRNPRLHYRDGLHAKVYLSDEGVVIGSANPSDNGVGFQPEGARHIEAGVFASRDRRPHSPWTDACRWFERQWRGSGRIDRDALSRARDLWNRRRAAALGAGAAVGGPRQERRSLLTLVRENPRLFEGIGFVFVRRQTPMAERKAALARDRNEIASFAEVRRYEQFGGGWTVRDYARWPEYFLEFWMPAARISIIRHRRIAALPVARPRMLYAERLPWRGLGPPLDLLLPRKVSIEKDARLIRALMGKHAGFLLSAEQLAKAIARA